jgi:hypothetical protein
MTFCEGLKLGLFCDTFNPATEKRRDDEVKVVRLTLRVQPLTPEVAAAIDPIVRRTLFKQQHPDPTPYMHEVTFTLDVPRQLLKIYASRDSPKPSIAFDQVHIGRLRTRLEKAVEGWALIVKVTFGPCSAAELAYVQEWYGTQRFVAFSPAEAELAFGDPDANANGPDDPDEAPAPTTPRDGAELVPADQDVTTRARRPRRARTTPTTTTH